VLSADPSRTGLLRRALERDVARRYSRLAANFSAAQARDVAGRWTSGAAAAFKKQYEKVRDKPVAKQVDKALSFSRKLTAKLFAKLEVRYGRKTAVAIMLSAQGLGWGALGVGAAFGVPLYLPGASIWGAVPAVALAEAVHQLKRGARKLTANVDVEAEARALLQELHDEYVKHLSTLAVNAADVPDVRQREGFDCGAAAFLAVLRSLGSTTSEDQVAALLRTSAERGTDVKDMVRAARELQLDPREIHGLRELELALHLGQPVVCAVQRGGDPDADSNGHYVVALDTDSEGVLVQDPVDGRRWVPLPEWLRRWHDVGADGSRYTELGVALGPSAVGSFAEEAGAALLGANARSEWHRRAAQAYAAGVLHAADCVADAPRGFLLQVLRPERARAAADRGFSQHAGAVADAATRFALGETSAEHELAAASRASARAARWTVVSAQAEGQLDAFEKLGVNRVRAVVEWTAQAGACEECSALDGAELTVAEARGLLPVHPNCRCAWAPATNAFCATGKGGGRDPSCSKGAKASRAKPKPKPAAKAEPALELAKLSQGELLKHMRRAAEPAGKQQVHEMGKPESMVELHIGGTSFKWAKGAEEDAAYSMSTWLKLKVPPKLAAANAEVAYATQRSSKDAYWGKKYGMKDFRTEASGGGGKVCVYDTRCHGATLAHEAGHNFARATWGDSSPKGKYAAAASKEPPVTKYGSNSASEDFAEACMLYVTKRASLKRKFPLKHAALEELFGG
jgi:predicted double-glycine peptidase